MEYGQIFLVSLAILTVLMIGAVSAGDISEDNSTFISGSDEEISETAISDVGQINDDYRDALSSQVQNFDGTTFTELQDKINNIGEGDSLELENDIVQDSNSQIEITKTISIDGKGHTIDALGKSGIFKVNGENIVLKNIRFVNARSDSWGSAISWEGYGGILTDCIFINNTASYGGAVYLENVQGIVSHLIFENNSAEFGGALALYEEQISVDNCIFINNSAGTGGAVDCSGWNCQINNSKFINNSASIGSGAIAWYGEDGSLFNSSFVKNHADMASGAIDWTGDNGKMSHCIFNSNYADDHGALSLICGNIFVNNTQFINNTAISETGGAIYSQSDNAIFNNILFENNSAIVAGAIYWAGEGSKFENITFLNNSAKIAPDLYINGENSELINVQLSGDENSLVVGEDVSNVPVIKQKVSISLNLIKFANNALLNISLSKNMDINIVVSVNGSNQIVKSKKGIAILNLTDLPNGDYNISVTVNESNIISNQINDSFNIYVVKTKVVSSDFVTYEYSKEKLKISLFDENNNPIPNKKLKLIIGETVYSASIGANGVGLRNINLPSGNYNLMIVYEGNDTYLKSYTNISLIVKPKVDIVINVSKTLNNVSLNISLSKNINDTLMISLNGVNTTVKSVNGTVNWKFSDLDYGNYTIEVYMDDKYYYNHVEENFTVNVKKTRIKCEDLDTILGNMSEVSLILQDNEGKPIAGKAVKLNWFNGSFENFTDESGSFLAKILFNNTGVYPISVSFEGDELYLPSGVLLKVKVKNLISADVSIKKLYNDVSVDISLSEKINSTLKVLVNDKEYDVNVINGKVSLKLNDLKKDTYKISLILNNDAYTFGSSSQVTDFKVTEQDIASKNSHSKNQKIKLTLKKVKVKKSAKKLVLKVTLKINGKVAKGKKITFKFNKKIYKAKTNKKGVAKVTIKKSVLKKLKVGKKVKYQASYGKKTVKKSVVVKN